FDAAFMVQGSKPGNYPYILVQFLPRTNSGGTSYEQIERDLSKDFSGEVKAVEGKLSVLAKNLSLGQPVLDRSKNRVMNRLQMDVMLVGKIQGLSLGTLGKDGVAFLHCYARDGDFDRL